VSSLENAERSTAPRRPRLCVSSAARWHAPARRWLLGPRPRTRPDSDGCRTARRQRWTEVRAVRVSPHSRDRRGPHAGGRRSARRPPTYARGRGRAVDPASGARGRRVARATVRLRAPREQLDARAIGAAGSTRRDTGKCRRCAGRQHVGRRAAPRAACSAARHAVRCAARRAVAAAAAVDPASPAVSFGVRCRGSTGGGSERTQPLMGVGPLACGDPSPSPSGKVELPRGATHGPQMWPAHACTIRPYDLCTGCCACDGEDCAVAQISGEALNRRVYAPRSGRGVPSKASLLAASDSLFSMQKSTLQTAAAADAVGVLTMVLSVSA